MPCHPRDCRVEDDLRKVEGDSCWANGSDESQIGQTNGALLASKDDSRGCLGRDPARGGVSLLDERWDAGTNVLSGKSAVVGGDPYVLTVHLPAGFRLAGAAIGAEKVEVSNQEETATVRIVPPVTKTVEWNLAFAK